MWIGIVVNFVRASDMPSVQKNNGEVLCSSSCECMTVPARRDVQSMIGCAVGEHVFILGAWKMRERITGAR
jgi:hypothetical protein